MANHSKKNIFGDGAERLYVIDGFTVRQIAEAYQIGKKAIYNWSADGNWTQKRKEYLESGQAVHQKIQEIKRRYATQILDDAQPEGSKINFSDIHALSGLIRAEKGLPQEKPPPGQQDKPGKSKGLTKATAGKIEEVLTGIISES